MSSTLQKNSHCKVNLILNILGRRADGFHELETIFQPVPLFDELSFSRAPGGVALSCSIPELPTDSQNLVHRAATAFLSAAKISDGVKIHLEKRVPLAAGLGGGSANAATTLLGLNELFGQPLPTAKLADLAAALGSDVPFFLHSGPAIASGRGEKIESCAPFLALKKKSLMLIHPGFGVSTAWAYKNLARFPGALNGRAGRAQELAVLLKQSDLAAAAPHFYNSLEAPVLDKYPLLAIFQEFLRDHGAAVALMSGSGSTTFAIFENNAHAQKLVPEIQKKFGETTWTAVVEV